MYDEADIKSVLRDVFSEGCGYPDEFIVDMMERAGFIDDATNYYRDNYTSNMAEYDQCDDAVMNTLQKYYPEWYVNWCETLYTVTTIMDANCRAVQTTIAPTEYDPSYHPYLPMNTQLSPCGNGCVARVEYYTNFNNMIRALRGEEVKQHKVAHALVGIIEALTGIA